MEDYIPEKNFKDSVLPLTIEKMEKILFQMKSFVCKIIKKSGQQDFFVEFHTKTNYYHF